jgi:ABC-type phosphate/phosphonate transport system permease subunit
MDTSAFPSTKPAQSQADLLYEAQQKKQRQFKTWVGITWGTLLLILVVLFSGQEILGYQFIQLDTEFMRRNLTYIAGGLWETLIVSFLSIGLAMVLALLAALGRLSTFPPIYAISTFYALSADFLLLPCPTAIGHHPVRQVRRGPRPRTQLRRLYE